MVTLNSFEDIQASSLPKDYQQTYIEEIGEDDIDEEERIYELDGDYEDHDIQGDAVPFIEGPQRDKRGPYAKKWTEARKKRNAEFGKWFKKVKDDGVVRDLEPLQDDEKMSTKALITSTTHIIAQPRDYQLELFEIAKRQNTLAVLDTGSGKTLIACLLIRHMISEELEARRLGKHRRVSFFLVDSVTLVFQQTAVLSCNIDAKIGKFCGDMCADLWNIESWTQILEENQVIVMTADVLHNCLTHAFIKMEDINLLCFDEAHHAKKNHVYARIIKDFYLSEPIGARPKIFGMTASPVDARVDDVVAVATELESLLDSRITTTSDLSLIQNAISRPQEIVAEYSPLGHPYETTLYKELQKLYGGSGPLSKVFNFAYNASSELGEWCAEYVWTFALSELESQKLERKTEKELDQNLTEEQTAKIEKDIETIREARKYVSEYTFVEPKPTLDIFSSKVIMLHNTLHKLFLRATERKCIIFVTRRYTARVLFEFLQRTPPKYLKLGILIGSRGDMSGDSKFSLRQQMLNVSRFRRGVLNCLIATSVAEEGLDIPDCNTVIRFDLYTTMIQYVQSRGRARHSSSTYIHMVEKGNRDHMCSFTEVRGAEATMRKFCQSLPKDRLMDVDAKDEDSDPDYGIAYVEPETKAKLTESAAMNLIAHYVGHLPHEDDDICQPTYIIKASGPGGFVCELLLPSSSPLYAFEGQVSRTKAGAKRSVAFDACMQLRAANLLDEYLLPRYRVKSKPKMANAHLALDAHKTNSYAYRNKPEFWKVDDGEPPKELFLTYMVVRNPENLHGGKKFSQLGLFTRKPLPPMPSFIIYGDNGGTSIVDLINAKNSFEPTPNQQYNLNEYTLRCFSDVFNKIFISEMETMCYWVTPLKDLDSYTPDVNPEDALDMECLSHFNNKMIEMPWDPEFPELLVDRFFVDRVTRARRFTSISYEKYRLADDPIPEDATRVPHIEECDTIKDFSYNHGKRGAKYKFVKWGVDEGQPVYKADRVLHRLDYLEKPKGNDANCLEHVAYIVPGAFFVSWIPMSQVRAIMIFPAISTRIDSYLHAAQVCSIVGMNIDLRLALEAITKDSDNTHEHGTEQVGKQSGMGSNYERLEFLGDCYLKLGTSIALYVQSNTEDEFQMHVKRMVLVCNQNLFDKACLMGIPAYIQTQGFSRRFWYPQMRLMHGKNVGVELVKEKDSVHKHRLGDKSIADVCEALIGAALLDQSLDGAAHMVTCILKTPDHIQTCWADYYKSYVKPGWQTATPTASQQKLADDIKAQFGYEFKSPRVLMSSFAHASNPFSYEKVPCYQRLEFLGDALLDQACVRYIFDQHPLADPQWLTEHKMAMVSNKFLGAVCVVLGLHRKLRKVGTQLDVAIRDYEAEILETREHNSSPDFWVRVPSPPKALPDILEAFIGALFVDSEFNYDIVLWFFDTYIKPYFVDMTLYDDFAGQHPTTFLTKELTNRGCENWGYESEQYKGTDEAYMVTAVMLHDKVFAYGKGVSAKAARVDASEKALKKLNKMREVKFYNLCDCIRTKKVVVDAEGVAVEEKVEGVEEGEAQEKSRDRQGDGGEGRELGRRDGE